jgi:hypothetical protein
MEDEVMGRERFDDLGARWVDVVINLVVGGLGIFTDTESKETGQC